MSKNQLPRYPEMDTTLATLPKQTDTTPVQRCLPNAGSTETVTAGNGTRQHLTRRMSRNSRLQADVDVRELGGRQGPGKAPPLQALRVQAQG